MKTYREIAEDAIKKYPSLDPARVERALMLVTNPQQRLKRASIDENGNPIIPTASAWVVRSSARPPYKKHEKIWYIVHPHRQACQCYDSQQGNVCKHRIAVYLMMERQGITDYPAEPIRYQHADTLAQLGYY